MTGTTDGTTSYYFRVLAENAVADVNGGASAKSAVAGPVVSGGVPGAPTDVFGVSGDRKVTVGWTGAGGATVANSGSVQYYTIYTDPPPQSTCGDAGDWATCGIHGQAAHNHNVTHDVASLAACKALCVANLGDNCRSIDYNDDDDICYQSSTCKNERTDGSGGEVPVTARGCRHLHRGAVQAGTMRGHRWDLRRGRR